MDYTDRLSEIFGDEAPRSLRTIFDCDGEQWRNTTIEKKVFFVTKMLESGYPLESWISDYIEKFKNTHPHILNSIDKSIGAIENEMENKVFQNNMKVYLEDAPKREMQALSKAFLFNSYFNLKEGIETACIKRAYRDMNRTLSEFEIVLTAGVKNPQKTEGKRKVVRDMWQTFLETKISELKMKVFDNNDEYDEWHADFCRDLMDVSSHKLTLGQAQKWINMIVKYLVVFGEKGILRNVEYFHIPIDGLIMDELHRSKMFQIAKLNTPWSKIQDQEQYLDYQKRFRKIVSPKSPLEMEFRIFNKILLKNNSDN